MDLDHLNRLRLMHLSSSNFGKKLHCAFFCLPIRYSAMSEITTVNPLSALERPIILAMCRILRRLLMVIRHPVQNHLCLKYHQTALAALTRTLVGDPKDLTQSNTETKL